MLDAQEFLLEETERPEGLLDDRLLSADELEAMDIGYDEQ